MLGQSTLSIRGLAARGAAAVVMAAGLVLTAGTSAQAIGPSVTAAGPSAGAELVCSGGGSVTIEKQADGTYNWLLSGVGSCSQARIAQVRQVTLLGKATTAGLGLCSGEPLIAPFNMSVAATFVQLTPTRGSVTTIQAQFWRIPASTFPVVAEFGITDVGGSLIGAGELETHVFVQCPPDGQPTMQVNWVQSA